MSLLTQLIIAIIGAAGVIVAAVISTRAGIPTPTPTPAKSEIFENTNKANDISPEPTLILPTSTPQQTAIATTKELSQDMVVSGNPVFYLNTPDIIINNKLYNKIFGLTGIGKTALKL